LWTGSRYEQVEQGVVLFYVENSRSQYFDLVKKMVKAKLNRAEQIRLLVQLKRHLGETHFSHRNKRKIFRSEQTSLIEFFVFE
jgi:hypothetical protein